MKEVVDNFRNNPLHEIAGYKVLSIKDYKLNKTLDLKTNKESETGLPNSNVLYYELENDAWCCVRPSGTEPKLKFYMGEKTSSVEESCKEIDKIKRAMEALI